MGNREALLAGAKKCLLDKGYARTTVRDIASAADVSMAAIGYHFGSKEALLNAALVELNGAELGDELQKAMHSAPEEADPLERFAATWDELAPAYERHRALLAAGVDALGQAEHSEDVRKILGQGPGLAMEAIGTLVSETHPDLDDQAAADVGALYYTLMNGLINQWLVDPDGLPDGHRLANALRTLTKGAGPTRNTRPASGIGDTEEDPDPKTGQEAK